MASATSAASPAVSPAVSSDWLKIDTTAAQAGYGPAEVPGPDTDTVPDVPTPQNPLAPEGTVAVPAIEAWLYDPENAGPWPSVPSEGNAGEMPIQRPEGGLPQGGSESLSPQLHAPGMWASAVPLAGYDAQSQVTDNAGWFQNVPTGRTASWNTFGQANPENNPTWPDFGERPVQPHLAITAVDLTSDSGATGTPGIADGSLPDWTATGSQGNTVYETPGPPPTSQPVSAGSLIDDSGWA